MGCCKYFCSAIAAAIISMFAYHMHTNVGLPDWYWEQKLPPNVEALDIKDTTRLKAVLFSGEPWLLQCYSGLPYAGQHLPAPFRLDPTFTESLQSTALKGIVKGGTLDCEARLPNNPNKTLVSKFGLVRRSKPLLLYAGGGDRPLQVPAASASSVYGVTAWVKPKAEPKVRYARSQKAVVAYCAGRRACLLTRLPKDSAVLEQLARKYRTVEVVSVGEDAKLAWGRGEEVGESLEPEEEVHFGKAVSLLRADPDAPRPTRRGARPPPRLLSGYGGAEDVPSLSRFVEQGLAASAAADGASELGFVRAELPTLTVPEKPKRAPKKAADSKSDAERQAKRAKARDDARKKEEAAAAAARAGKAEELKAQSAEARREAEQRRREQMAAEEAAANNLVEDVDDDDDAAGGGDDEVEEVDDFDGETEDDGSDVLDLDA